MPPIEACFRAGEILVEMNENGAGYVRFEISATPVLVVREVVATVEHDPVGIAEMGVKVFRADESGEHQQGNQLRIATATRGG
jgi:hypothetical protein